MSIVYMLIVVCTYTICTLNDKYAVSKARIGSNEFTFLIAMSTSFFMTAALPFSDRFINFSPMAIVFIGLVAADKLLELQTISKVLKELSAFEVKAWLGLCVFMSYVTDIVLYGENFRLLKLLCIFITVSGLFLIVKDNRRKINYRKIVFPLALYLFAKYGYGAVIRQAETYVSSYMAVYIANIIVMLMLLTKVNPIQIFRNNPKGAGYVCLARIPNVIGIVAENAVIHLSLVNYSFIQPMILVMLFIISIARHEHYTKKNLAGSIICMVGIIGFQLMGVL